MILLIVSFSWFRELSFQIENSKALFGVSGVVDFWPSMGKIIFKHVDINRSFWSQNHDGGEAWPHGVRERIVDAESAEDLKERSDYDFGRVRGQASVVLVMGIGVLPISTFASPWTEVNVLQATSANLQVTIRYLLCWTIRQRIMEIDMRFRCFGDLPTWRCQITFRWPWGVSIR